MQRDMYFFEGKSEWSKMNSNESEKLTEKGKGLWHNIRAKRARGEAPAKKGSKAYKKAKKAADDIKASEGVIKERTAKATLEDAVKALMKTIGGKKLDQRYVKDYLKSMERLARKKPMDFVKDYGDFSVADWIEDVKYNLQNEGAYGWQTMDMSSFKGLKTAKKGAKAKGGGYGPFVKISGDSWKNPKTGRLMHSKALASHIGGFDDFIIEGKINEGIDPHDVKLLAKAKPGKKIKLKSGEVWIKMGNPKDHWTCTKGKEKGVINNPTEMAQHLYRMVGKGIGYKITEIKLTEDFSQRARNFRVNLRMRMKDLKIGGKIIAYKMTFTKEGPDSYSWKGTQKWTSEAVVKKIKLAAVKDIMKWKQGASGAPMVNAFLKFEGKVNESSAIWKALDAKWKLQDQIMDLEYDMKMITKDLAQLHKDMEQEAEPEGGPKATKYGKEIEKKEKEYKKKKAEFKKLMAKLDKLEQY
jgi:hypothetical protein